MMLKIDLHTHSIESPDGSLKPEDYIQFIKQNKLDIIAITDHNSIGLALELSKKNANIIVGEEIMTSEGEIIGLYLEKLIKPGLSPEETCKLIKKQNGLVYIPHPFEKVRSGISLETLNSIKKYVDIIEYFNGRALIQHSKQILDWAKINHVVLANSSDAHGINGLGYCYSNIDKKPKSAKNLLELLEEASLSYSRPKILAYLEPKLNKFKSKK